MNEVFSILKTEIGQIVFGKPASKVLFSRKDLIEIEMIINLLEVVVENGSRKS